MSTKVADVFAGMTLNLKAYSQGLKQAEHDADATGKKIDKAISLKTILQDLELGRKKMLVLRDAGTLVGSTLKKVGVDGLNKGLGVTKGLLGDIVKGFALGIGFTGFQALGNALADLIRFIPSVIESGQAFARTVDDISDKTGASAENSSRFAGTLQYLGINTQGLGQSLRVLSTEIVANEEKFRKLGIATRDNNDVGLDTITILNNVRSYLAGAGDGYTKTALAADLLGRSSGELIDFLNLTDAEAQALAMTMDDLGVTISETARRDAEQLKRETNLLGLAWQGLANTLANEAAPTIRNIIGGLTSFIKENGAQIRQTFLDITNAVLGFVSGLVGIGDIQPFGVQLAAIADGGSDVALSFEQWAQQMGHTIPKIEKVTGSTKAGTDAIDKQIKSVDRAIAAEQRRDDASETIFQRTMRRLAGEYGARLSALDLEERELAMADRDKDLAEQLRQAKIDLFEAQARLREDTLAGEDTDQATLGVADAQQSVLDAQKAIADEAAQRDRDAQRARLEGVQTYIENLARIEAESENKKALAVTLQRREDVLTGRLAVAQAADDADAIADINAQLEAIHTAEERTQAAIRSGDKEKELSGLKAQLERQRQAIQAANSGQKTDNAKLLADLKVDYDKYLAAQAVTARIHSEHMGKWILGDPAKGTGVGGAITKAFADGQKAGEAFRTFLADELLPAVQDIADAFGLIVDALSTIADNADLISRLGQFAGSAGTTNNPLNPQPSREDVATANKLIPEFVATYNEKHGGADPTEAQIRKYLHDKGVKGFAQGAWDIPADMLGRLDRGEMVVPQPFAERLRPALSVRGEGVIPSLDGDRGASIGRGIDLILDWIGTVGRVGQAGPELAWLGEEAAFDLPNTLADKLERLAMPPFTPPAPAPAMAAASSGTLIVEHLSLDLGGNRAIDLFDQMLGWRRRR